jgi:hypothetical protein
MTMNRQERAMMDALSKSANELDEELEAERRHSRMLAETLRGFHHVIPSHERYIVAVLGTDLSWGDVVRGALARHELRTRMEPEE